MAHGENARKNGHHREYWSRRPCAGMGWGKAIKEMTHRRERRDNIRHVRGELARTLLENHVNDDDMIEIPTLIANDNEGMGG